MRIVVTGATSFIGAAAVRRLLMAGHQVYAVARPGSANLPQLLAAVPDGKQGNLRVVELDLKEIGRLGQVTEPFAATESSGTAEAARADAAAFEGNGRVCLADVWLHGGWDGSGSELRARRDVQQANVVQSVAALRTAAALGCRRFVFTGSQAEYGVRHERMSEEMELRPVSEYGKAKVDFGNEARRLSAELGIAYVHARIYSVYGPGDHPWSLVNSCLKTFCAGGEMKLGECCQQWNFLYINDAAEALCRLAESGAPGTYNIGSEDTRSLREYVGELHRLCGGRGSLRYGERPQNAEGPADLMPDITKICAETGWRPSTSFAEGIYETMYRLRL